jgi:hypothetical protein
VNYCEIEVEMRGSYLVLDKELVTENNDEQALSYIDKK